MELEIFLMVFLCSSMISAEAVVQNKQPGKDAAAVFREDGRQRYTWSSPGLKCTCRLNGGLVSSKIRQKRGIIQLSGTIHCGTGRSSLSYLGYGCYCGLGGQGTPKDMADWCCYKHDCCYGYAEHFGCHPKSNAYNWKCVKNYIKCDYTRDLCQTILCKCDKNLAKCLQKAPYKAKYVLYPNFLCGNEVLQCKSNND